MTAAALVTKTGRSCDDLYPRRSYGETQARSAPHARTRLVDASRYVPSVKLTVSAVPTHATTCVADAE